MENEILSILKNMQAQMNGMEAKIDEHTLILRTLEHLAQVNKAEHDQMSHDISSITGDVKSIKQDLAQVELVTANNWADIVRLKAVK